MICGNTLYESPITFHKRLRKKKDQSIFAIANLGHRTTINQNKKYFFMISQISVFPEIQCGNIPSFPQKLHIEEFLL